MLIEFQNCSLSIGYIGTPQEIAVAMILDAFQDVINHVKETFRRLGEVYAEVAREILAAMPPVGRNLGLTQLDEEYIIENEKMDLWACRMLPAMLFIETLGRII